VLLAVASAGCSNNPCDDDAHGDVPDDDAPACRPRPPERKPTRPGPLTGARSSCRFHGLDDSPRRPGRDHARRSSTVCC